MRKKQVSITDEESATKPGQTFKVVYRCFTVAQAEAWIGRQMVKEPDKVARGGYGINAPEALLNP